MGNLKFVLQEQVLSELDRRTVIINSREDVSIAGVKLRGRDGERTLEKHLDDVLANEIELGFEVAETIYTEESKTPNGVSRALRLARHETRYRDAEQLSRQ